MAKYVIHAGGIFANPMLHREGSAAADTMPGTIGTYIDGKFTASVDGKEAAILYVANFDYLRCKTVSDELKAGDWVVAIHPQSGMFLNVRADAGTYKKGQALAVVNGRVKAAAEGDSIRAFVEEDTATTVKAGELLRVVIK